MHLKTKWEPVPIHRMKLFCTYIHKIVDKLENALKFSKFKKQVGLVQEDHCIPDDWGYDLGPSQINLDTLEIENKLYQRMFRFLK